MSFFADLKDKLSDPDYRRQVGRVLLGVGAAAGLYVVYRKGYKNGHARGFERGYGEARTEEALMLEGHDE